MLDRVPDAGRERVVVLRVLVVDEETRLLIIQEDPDREDPGTGRHPDDALRTARAAAVTSDD
jgi:hypothetical protein